MFFGVTVPPFLSVPYTYRIHIQDCARKQRNQFEVFFHDRKLLLQVLFLYIHIIIFLVVKEFFLTNFKLILENNINFLFQTPEDKIF